MASGNIQGSNYVQNPNTGREIYNAVEGKTAKNGDITIPSSGTTAVGGVTYLWTVNLDTGEGGFTGESWLLDNYKDVNPLVTVGGLYTVEQVIEYLEIHKNFNYIFSNWHPEMNDFNKFNSAFELNEPTYGCAHI